MFILDYSFHTSPFQVLTDNVSGEELVCDINQCLGHLHCIFYLAQKDEMDGMASII